MKRFGQTRLEWALLGIMAVVCAGLSFLQYRWTGELSRSDRARLRAGLDEQLHHLAQAFDEEMRRTCLSLLPNPEELREHGRAEAHRIRYEQWASSHDRGLFTRIAVAAPEQGTLKLYGLDNDGRLAPMDWPAEWAALQAAMTARSNGVRSPPAVPAHSTLIEMPVFESLRHRGDPGPELEWMIFDISEEYIGGKTLPRFVTEYLNRGSESVYDASVSWAASPGGVVFSTRPDTSSVAARADATIGIFPTKFLPPTGRRGQSRDGESTPRWILSARHHAGSLDAVVNRVRTRNLLISLVLIALLGGTALALVRSAAKSQRLSEMQFRFAAAVSHDLRTPLTAIRGAAFNIADGLVQERTAVEHYAKLILRNSEELTAMIENVLAFSASLHKDSQGRSEAVSIGDLLERAAAAMGSEIEQAGCRIELTVAPDLPGVAGDPIALEHAFRNLIGNAVRHASSGRWIGVVAAGSEGGVEVLVADRGPGIPEAEHKRIFEPFYRGEHTRAGRVRGVGLGLSLVKETIERHRGSVTIHNSPDGGAQFILRLPALPEVA